MYWTGDWEVIDSAKGKLGRDKRVPGPSDIEGLVG